MSSIYYVTMSSIYYVTMSSVYYVTMSFLYSVALRKAALASVLSCCLSRMAGRS